MGIGAGWGRAAAIAVLVASGHAEAAYRCIDEKGGVTIQQAPCPVVQPPAPPPPPPLACTRTPDEVRTAGRQEEQFLTRYHDEAAHRRKQLADLEEVVVRLRGTRIRFDDLVRQRKPINDELEFFKNKPVPPALQARVDASDAQFAAVADIARAILQDVASIQSRYQCERATFGKGWTQKVPRGWSACEPACTS